MYFKDGREPTGRCNVECLVTVSLSLETSVQNNCVNFASVSWPG